MAHSHNMNMDQLVRQRVMQIIDQTVAYWFGMTVQELHGENKTRGDVVPRQIASYLIRGFTTASPVEIGRHFDGRHESTIRRSVLRVEVLRRTVKAADLTVCGLIEQVQNALRRAETSNRCINQKVLSIDRVGAMTNCAGLRIEKAVSAKERRHPMVPIFIVAATRG
jgi:hypothetical protein